MAVMADCVGFQAQIASIIEMLANSAVVEICKLVEDGYAALRAQMDREREKSEAENEALRRELRDAEGRMRSYERRSRRRSRRAEEPPPPPPEALGPPGALGPPQELEDHMTCDTGPLLTSHMVGIEDTPHHLSQEEGGLETLVKKESSEKADCNLDLKVEVNIHSEGGLSSVLQTAEEAGPLGSPVGPPEPSAGGSTDPASCPPGDTVDLTCRGKRRPSKPGGEGEATGEDVLDGGGASDTAMKPEAGAGPEAESNHLMGRGVAEQPSPEQPSPERLSLGLDLAWMQERVSHLGAAFAVAQLGLGTSDSAHPAAATFVAQAGGGDCLDGPPTMVFPGAAAAAHDMAAFAASFDLAAAPPPSAGSPNQTRPYGAGVAKEAAVCGVCGRVFPSPAALELHRRVHAGERPFACPHCGKGFAQPNNLRVHLLIHSGERRYRCSLCGKSFISSSHLKRHRTVHTQEKPYSCARCGQSFSQMCSVRRHRQQSQCGL